EAVARSAAGLNQIQISSRQDAACAAPDRAPSCRHNARCDISPVKEAAMFPNSSPQVLRTSRAARVAATQMLSVLAPAECGNEHDHSQEVSPSAALAASAAPVGPFAHVASCTGPGAPSKAQTRCLTAVQIPGNPLRSFDISWVNADRGEYYLGDR